MKTTHISYSITKNCVILTYLVNGIEINALIEPFQFCAYLRDLNLIEGITRGLLVHYNCHWLTWLEFMVESSIMKLFTDEVMQAITEHHHESEAKKAQFFALNN